MKKVLTLALILFITVVATGQEAYIQQRIKEDISNLTVGDTITLHLQWEDRIDDQTDPNPTTVQFDWKYNKDLLQLVSHEFFLDDNTNASRQFNSWLNYTYLPGNPEDGDPAQDDLSAQYYSGLRYDSNTSWGINRVTVQDSGEIIGNTGNGDRTIIEVKYIVRDVAGTQFTDYTDVITLNWAYLKDNTNNTAAYSVFASPLSLSLEEVSEPTIPAGQVTFRLDIPQFLDKETYDIVIDKILEDGTYEYVTGGDLDVNGVFTTTVLQQDIKYSFHVFVEEEYNPDTDSYTRPQWLDDVVTVSDVILAFKQAIGTNPDGSGNVFQYNIQKHFANVKQSGPNDPVDLDDSYVLLSHIAGILDNSAGVQQPVDGQEFYPISSFNNGAFNWSGFFDSFGTDINSEEEWIAARSITLTDDQPVEFKIAHGLMGDVDLSHSTTPPLNSETTYAARGNFNILKAGAQEDRDLDITSQLIDGKVILEVNLQQDDLAGMQFNINYDKSILTFDDITFDTGNDLTNFAKQFDNGRINFGAINIEESTIKKGVPFKLVFTPKVSIQNTSGLISFRVTDAVKTDGTKINLNLR